MESRIVSSFTTLACLTVYLLSNPAEAYPEFGGKPILADQYQCSKSKDDRDQVVDVLINGSSQRFQGIARSKDGRLLEVAGVIADYYAIPVHQVNSDHQMTAAQSKRAWDTFAVEVQLANKAYLQKSIDSGQLQTGFTVGGVATEGAGWMPGGAYGGGFVGSMGDGPAYGAGMTGGYAGNSGPGDLIRIGLVSKEELAEIRMQAIEIIDKRDARVAAELADRQKKIEHDRIFGPPPLPAAHVAPPRAGDLVPLSQGSIAASTARAGDIASMDMRAGDKVGYDPLPGTVATSEMKAGEKVRYNLRPGDVAANTLRRGDHVGKAAGAVIGSANSLTFTALIDPKTGKVSKIVYREENRSAKTIQFSENLKSNDPIQARITQFINRTQAFAKCCEHDSIATCDQKYSPESQAALKTFREETTSVINEADSGGAIFNPFSGKPAPVGTYGPSRAAPAKVKSQNPTAR